MFNLHDIIKAYDLDKQKAARVLFPTNKQHDRALERVLSFESMLDTDQLERLARWLKIPVSLLFGSWRATRSNGRITFQKERYQAFFDDGMITVTLDGEAFDTILCDTHISIADFIHIINRVTNGNGSKSKSSD
jgi:hypothetical protein